ncbi:MAG: translation initiation factor IF-2 [Armatimonadetes bacterium]|nr:translation initiation factor IF-2 [Armatimonadota bacterium]
MKSVKVSEIAKEIGIATGPLLATLKDLGVEVSGATSAVDEGTAELVKEIVSQDESRRIEVGQSISVRELADAMHASPADVQKRLVEMGILASVNQQIAPDIATKVAEKFGYRVQVAKKDRREAPAKPPVAAKPKPKRAGKTIARPPVVTILGHVDHGKTTLLDRIRRTNVTAGEFGGITQHIGAYQVDVDGRKITFLDTPGHAAFTAMRARGAGVTDIAVLVVAADDAVMPQTVEAIDHARAANVPIIAAINKIDKADANVERTKQQLMEHGLVPEEWGGDTIMVELSAKEGRNIEELLEMILLVADMQELSAPASAKDVEGTIVEAKLDRGKGPVATVLVQKGTLRVGTPVVAGTAYGKIKAMLDENGERLFKAGPATPVEILGLSRPPLAGDVLVSVKDDRQARQIAEERSHEQRAERMATESRLTLEDLYRKMQEGEVKELNIVLKSDVQGSAEAVRQSLERIEHEEVRVKIIHSAVGNVSESDILLAAASNAVVIGFNVKVDSRAADMAEAEHVEVRTYNVIYELINDVRAAMGGLLEPIYEEVPLGKAEIRATFRVPKVGLVAGCYVTEGKVTRTSEVRIRRGNDVIFEGKVDTLKHLKEDVKEMAAGFECGIAVEGFQDYQVGDVIEAFTRRRVARAV